MNNKPNPLLGQIIGAYQLFAGGYGALFFAVQIIRAGGASLGRLVFIALYVLVAYAGYALLKGRSNGVRLTVLAQALQVVRIASSSLAYAFLAGLAFWIELGTRGLQMPGLRFGVSFDWVIAGGFGSRGEGSPFTIGVNLIALAIVLYFLYGGKSGSRKKKR